MGQMGKKRKEKVNGENNSVPTELTLPLPVCPYAKTLQNCPSNTAGIKPLTVRS
jgi:hypothetical protein